MYTYIYIIYIYIYIYIIIYIFIYIYIYIYIICVVISTKRTCDLVQYQCTVMDEVFQKHNLYFAVVFPVVYYKETAAVSTLLFEIVYPWWFPNS